MSIYYGVMTIISLTYFFSGSDKSKQKWSYICLCILLLLLTFVRYEHVGDDTGVYVEYFHRFRNLSFSDCLKWNLEPGYILLNKLIAIFSGETRFFLIAMGAIVTIPIFCFIWKKSELPLLSLLIFVAMGHWFSTMGIFRQWCAVTVLVYGYDCIIKRKLIPFCLSVAVAYTFHKTAVFVLPLYFIYGYKVSSVTLIGSGIMSVLLALSSDHILALINMFARTEQVVKSGMGYTLLVVLWVSILVIDLLAKNIENERYMRLNYLTIIYSATIQPLSLTVSNIARVHIYCWFGLTLGLPCFIKAINDKQDMRNIHFMKICVIAVLFLWFTLTSDRTWYAFM